MIEIDFFDEVLGKRMTHFIGSLIIVYAYYKEYALTSRSGFIIYVLISCLYLVIIWAPKSWRNLVFYSTGPSLVIGMALIFHFLLPQGPSATDFLWPLAWLLAVFPKKYESLSLTFFSTSLIVIVILSNIYPIPWLRILTLIGIYMGIRSRKIRQDAYRLNMEHLEELDKAHENLKQAHSQLLLASAQSMRYAALAERTRLAREIHDGIGHHLTSLVVQLQAVELMLPHDANGAAKVIPDMLSVARQGMAEIRLAVREWASDESGLGLIAMRGLLSQTQANSKLNCEFTQNGEVSEWPSETGVVLYRVLQESLTNIMRHAKGATTVHVSVKEFGNEITLTIADDGEYTGNQPITFGFGLNGMVERCKSLGGKCSVSPNEPHGLKLQIAIPIQMNLEDANFGQS